MKENLDDAEAGIGIGFDMLDVIDRRRQHALIERGDAPRHVIGRQAIVLPGHGNHRNSDLGKDVHRRTQRRQRTHYEQQHSHDDKCIRPFEGYSYYFYHGLSELVDILSTTFESSFLLKLQMQ